MLLLSTFCAGFGLVSPTLAQNGAPRTISVAGNAAAFGIGERVALPFANVSRIIVEDDQIAQASFLNGVAVLRGVSAGTTLVEIYQTDGTPKVLTVVVSAASTALPVPTPAPTTSANTTTSTPPIQVLPVEPAPQPDPVTTTPVRADSRLTLALGAKPVAGALGQAEFTLTFGNLGFDPAENVTLRFALDDRVSYVTGSANGEARYDATKREVVWDLGLVPAGVTDQTVSLRVQPIERTAITFDSVATLEQKGLGEVAKARLTYSTNTTPLLTVFALPDRFIVGKNQKILTDVRGSQYQTAVDRLSHLGVVSGRETGLFYPKSPTKRAEYAVMTLNGLALRDLRDVTQIKFVLGRRSTVSLLVQNERGQTIFNLVRSANLNAGEHTALWNGRTATGFAAPGRYTYVCTARDEKGQTTTLRGTLSLVAPQGLKASGVPSFIDVKASDWYARYLAVGEEQGLLRGYTDKTFRPQNPISRLEATAIVVRALGLEDTAKQWADKDVGFLDYENIPNWGKGYVNVASTVAKTSSGGAMMRGTAQNRFEPEGDLQRDQAALVVQRIIDRETTRRVSVSGAIVPGALVSINSQNVEADAQGKFSFSFDLNTAVPTTVAVVDTRDR